MIPLHRYWKIEVSDHLYTNDPSEIGTTVPGQKGKYNYAYERIQCFLYLKQIDNSVPLYRYFNNNVSDHLYTTDEGEIGTITPMMIGNDGYKFESIVGYCLITQDEGTVPLYRYWNPRNSDHFYTTDGLQEIGTVTEGETRRHGYTSQGVVCYVHPAH